MQCNILQNFIKTSSSFKIVLSKSLWDLTVTRNYAKPAASGIPSLGGGKKKLKGAGPTLEKKIVPAETDPYKLLTYVCGSCLDKEGGEDVKLKDDSEYPDWLWTLRTGPAESISELDPNTRLYWSRTRKAAMRRNNKLQKLKKF